jgi:hypothetical protein
MSVELEEALEELRRLSDAGPFVLALMPNENVVDGEFWDVIDAATWPKNDRCQCITRGPDPIAAIHAARKKLDPDYVPDEIGEGN